MVESLNSHGSIGLSSHHEKANHHRRSAFSWLIFGAIYLFFVLNTAVTPYVLKRFFVQAHPKYAISHTAQLYQLLSKNSSSMAGQVTSHTHALAADSMYTYLSVALHNSVLPLLCIVLLVVSLYLPQFRNKVLYHVTEYVRLISVLFFFAFGIIILCVNAILIPFILASLSYATHVPTSTLGITTLVHGLVEYISLSLLIMVAIQTWRLTLRQRVKTHLHAPTYSSNRNLSLLRRWLRSWYQSVFSERSISSRFRIAIRPVQLSVYKIYAVCFLVFLIAAFVEIYISPAVGNQLIAHS